MAQYQQIEESEDTPPELTAIASERTSIPEVGALESMLSDLQENNAAYQAAFHDLGRQGIQASAVSEPFGWTNLVERFDGTRLAATMIVQDVSTPGPSGRAQTRGAPSAPSALLSVVLRNTEDGQEHTRLFFLQGTPGEDDVEVIELGGGSGGGGGSTGGTSRSLRSSRFPGASPGAGAGGGAAGGSAVVPLAGTFWQRLVRCLRGCGGACITAIATCPKNSWAAFLGCIAVRCGVCAIKCPPCAACDCRWWCKWAAGCCAP
jgi:hypothetical protein